MDPILTFLSDYGVSLNFEELSSEVVHEVKRRTIDALGCAMGAYFMEPAKIARIHASEASANPGATLLGTRHRTTPELAAFANGVMVRYLDFNDTSGSKKSGHPSDNIPAVLAAAEYVGADARTVITGIVLAYEIQDRFGQASTIWNNGWDNITNTAISAAAGAGKVLGLNRQQMSNALALAATANIALLQTRVGTLSMWKGCAAANASRNGVFHALMARLGLTGPEEAFAGSRGFLRQVSGPMELPEFGGKDRPFTILTDKLKFFPTDHEAQCTVLPVLELRQALDGKVEDIEKVIIETYELALEIAADSKDKWAPTTRETADHSIPYVVAVALMNGTVWLDAFEEEQIRDPKIHTLMQKIEVRENKEYSRLHPESNCFRIEVITRSGGRHVREVRYPKGHPKNPMTDQEIEAKFRRLTESVFPPDRVEQILERLWNLEKVQNVEQIVTLFELP
ncbi:MAG: MmgE/PrpD family protein [Thermodesulfobacteriota bacterium]|nr:MmgE/PrpD family protein [Thermodesulfobacteriota bacterium]